MSDESRGSIPDASNVASTGIIPIVVHDPEPSAETIEPEGPAAPTHDTVTSSASEPAIREAAAAPVVTPQTSESTGKKSKEKRKRAKRAPRSMQDKATRASWRAFYFALFPLLAAGVTYYFYQEGKPLEEVAVSAAGTGALVLILAPFVLWFSVSAIRRGTRRLILSVILGFYSGALTVALIVAIVCAAIGYSLVMGEPIPFTNQHAELPGGIR